MSALHDRRRTAVGGVFLSLLRKRMKAVLPVTRAALARGRAISLSRKVPASRADATVAGRVYGGGGT